RVRGRIALSSGVHVPEHDAPLALKAIERLVVRGVAAIAVRYRNAEHIADFASRGEHRVRILDAHANRVAHELEPGVAQQRAGQEPGLAGDLESVAYAEHRSAGARVRRDLAHDRAEARDGTGAQVITVAEPSR